MSNDQEISDNIKLLENLNKELGEFDSYIDNLTKLNYEKTMNKISPKERVDLNWNMSYTIYSLYFSKI